MQQTETQHNLLKQASIQSIELINQFEDEITPIQFKCLKCHTESEEYPDMLLSFYHWCPKCRENPEEILLSLLNQLSIKIVDKNIKKLIDYKIERDGKKAFIYIQKSDESTVQLCDMANKANIKLIIIPLNLLIKNTPNLLSFIENAMNSVEKLIIFNESSIQELSSTIPVQKELSEQQLINNLLAEAGFPEESLIKLEINSNSFVSKIINAPKGVKLAYGYCRVSTKLQLEGHSIASQVNSIKNYCQYEKLHLSCVYFDLAMTGRNNNRPALKELMKKLNPTDTIVVASLSRLARNLKNSLDILEDIQQKQATLSLLDLKVNTDTALGKMLFTLVASLAEFESKQTGEHISTVMTNMSENNTLKSRPPYGWAFVEKGKPWIKVEKEQKMIEYIRMLRTSQPDLTVSQICRHLNNLKDPCLRKATKKWYESSLLRCLAYNKISIPKGDENKKLPDINPVEINKINE